MISKRHALGRVSVALLVIVSGAVLAVSRPAAKRARTDSREALLASFDSDVAELVYEWDREDSRPEPVRRAALREFVFQAYDSSAWIPQSVFASNAILQLVVGDADTIIRDRIGLVPWRRNRIARAYGMAPNPAPGAPLAWTVNCVACHSAEIDGVVYLGAGGKVLDEKGLVETVIEVTGPLSRQRIGRSQPDRHLAAEAHDILKQHHHEKLDSLTRARSTAFPASHVEMYMRVNDGKMPDAARVGRGDVKIPPLWHTVAKMPFGRWYCDGSFHGKFPLMASSMELKLDRSFDGLMKSVLPQIKEDFETVIQYLRPPHYPYVLNQRLAERGKALFYSEEIGCYKCHGNYDGKGGTRWTGTHADVGTDRSRIDVVSPGFVKAFDASPIATEGRLAKSRGYAATPLTGVWANYPYLHNGSVPTLYHLLGPEDERPRIFSVLAARQFDREKVGQRIVRASAEGMSESERLRAYGDDRDWFNADRAGCSNRGHNFWPVIKTEERRMALIEYLKTL
jgi:hypothetical protein